MKPAWMVIDLLASATLAVAFLHLEPSPSYLQLALGWFGLVNALVRFVELHAYVLGEAKA
jgi:hypothetical protein